MKRWLLKSKLLIFLVFLVNDGLQEFQRDTGSSDLHGVTMPELRSGARRSKRLGDLQPAPKPVDPVENCVLPAQNRTRRRVGGGRARGGNATLTKGPLAVTPVRAGRGRGVRLIDLDPEPPCQVLPEPVAIGVGEPVANRVAEVADRDVAMEAGSADKLGVEEEASTTPVPDRVSY